MNSMQRVKRIVFVTTLFFSIGLYEGSASALKATALEKIETLKSLMSEAEAQSVDVTREETVVWFAEEFLKYADWDEANMPQLTAMFGAYWFWNKEKEERASVVPEHERRMVNEILDVGIHTLEQVMAGKIKRRPAVKVDWENIGVEKDQLTSKGKPVFLYDYFSKSMGNPTSDSRLYNDHLGNIDFPESIASHCMNGDGTYALKRLHAVTQHPDTKVGYTMLWHKEQPDWVAKQYPDSVEGLSLFIGYDIDHPQMRSHWNALLQKVGEDTQGKKANQLGFILANEPHWFSAKKHWSHKHGEMGSLSVYTKGKFRRWLRTQYKDDLAKFNARWKTSYVGFEDVEIEFPLAEKELRGSPPWYDWCRFNMDRGTDWLRSLHDSLRKGNPSADTSVKIMPTVFTEESRGHGIDVEAITELTSMIGDDAMTRVRQHNSKKPEHWEERYAYMWEELAVAYDFLESVAPDKIHLNSESHFISASLWKEMDIPAAYIRNTYWLATLLGMDANLSWLWARDPDGSPEDRLEESLKFSDAALGGSFAGSVNMQPQSANEVTQTYIDLNAFSEEIMLLRRQPRPIRLFYSETSAINKFHHMHEQFELYESLMFEGLSLGYATEKILKKQDNNLWDVVLVYRTEYVTDSEFAELQRYLSDGGSVIIDEFSLTKNEYGEVREARLQRGSGQLIQMGATEFSAVKEEALATIAESRSSVVVTEENGTAYKGCIWRVAERPNEASILNLINVGKNPAKITVATQAGEPLESTNMLTGERLGSSFELGVHGVLLLKLTK